MFLIKKKIIAIHFNKESHLSIGFSANTGIQLYLCIHSRILPCSLQRVHIARSYRTRLSSSAVFTSIRMWTINREKVSRNVSMAPVMENATKLCICVYHDNFQLMNNWVNRKKNYFTNVDTRWNIFLFIFVRAKMSSFLWKNDVNTRTYIYVALWR